VLFESDRRLLGGPPALKDEDEYTDAGINEQLNDIEACHGKCWARFGRVKKRNNKNRNVRARGELVV